MKKYSYLIVIFLLFFNTIVKADDIRDFEIEGMSIGDSALDFFTKIDLKNALDIGAYKSEKFIYYFLEIKNSDTYEFVQIHVKKDDNNFIIHGVEGHIIYQENINKCYNKMSGAKSDLDKSFSIKSKSDDGKHPTDPTGKSTYSRIMYKLQNKKGYAEIICYDLSKEMESKGSYDRFVISLGTSELLKWLTYEAYK